MLFSVLARIVDVSVFGKISYFVILSTLLITTLDYGHRFLVVKELTQNIRKLSFNYLLEKISIKLVLFPFFLCLLLIYFFTRDFWGYPPFLILIFFTGSFFYSFCNLSYSVFHSANKFHLETISQFVSTSVLGVGVFVTYYFSSEIYFILFYAVSGLLTCVCSGLLLKKNFVFESNNKKKNKLGYEFKLAFPFALITIIDILFSSVDSYFIESFCSEHSLGVYQGILKVVMGLSIFAVVAISIGTPIISRLYKNLNKIAYYKIIGLFFLFLLSGVFVFLFYFFFNETFVLVLLGPKYIEIIDWDFNLALFALSRYLRIIPAIFFVISGFHWYRFFIVLVTLMISTVVLYVYLPGNSEKFAIRFMSLINFAMSVIYTILFFYLLNKQFLNLKK